MGRLLGEHLTPNLEQVRVRRLRTVVSGAAGENSGQFGD